MPALTVALHLSSLNEPGHHAIQVIRLDFQLLGELRNGDSRPRANELEGLVGTSVTAATTARATGTAACRRRGGGRAAATTV